MPISNTKVFPYGYECFLTKTYTFIKTAAIKKRNRSITSILKELLYASVANIGISPKAILDTMTNIKPP